VKKKRVPIEDKLAAIAEARKLDRAAVLFPFFEDEEPHVVGQAADAAIEIGARSLIAPLEAAFTRLSNGEQRDRGCMAALKVVQALARMEVDSDAFRVGLKMVRRERVGTEFLDVAAPIRSECAQATARRFPHHALLDIAPLLADPEPEVRAGVAHALGDLASDGAVALLHFKLLISDEDVDVLAACMGGLLRASRARFAPIVATYLTHEDDTIVELAAIALGESRAPEAFPHLRDALAGRRPGRATKSILLALALLRVDDATAHLLDLLAKAPEPLAKQVVEALALHPALEDKVRAILEARSSR
jgi:HEAT repeat protein